MAAKKRGNQLDRFISKFNKGLLDLNRNVSWYSGGRRFFEKYARDLIKAHKWCFIGGCNNSGTTLLKNLLADTGRVSTFASEGQVYTDTLVKAERRGYERVWTEYIKDVRLTSQDNQVNVPRLLHDWMRELDTPSHEMILEKTTLNAVRMTWLQENFPQSYFIGIVRNGFAVSEGIRRRGNKDIKRSARHWARVNEIMLDDSARVTRYLQVRYEDMARNPASVLQRAVEFLGLDLEMNERILQRIATVKDQNGASIGRLSEADLNGIQAEAGGMLELFGYSPGGEANYESGN